MTNRSRSVALLSNYSTRNLGNLLLTTIVQRLMAEAYGDINLIPLHRLPHPVAAIATKADFTDWVSTLESVVGDLPGIVRRAEAPSVGERVPAKSAAKEMGALGGTMESVARRVAHTTIGLRGRALRRRGDARHYLAGLLTATDVVWNAAGEIYTDGFPTERLLDLQIALEQGKRTAMVNFSFEPSPAAFRLFRKVIPRLTHAIGRDERTIEALVDAGLTTEKATLSPDAAFLLGSPVVPEIPVTPVQEKRRVIGIVLHGVKAVDNAKWARVIECARAAEMKVEILSSHAEIDIAVIRDLLAVSGTKDVTIIPEAASIEAYCRHVAQLRTVVTARFHTAVMSLVSGTVVVGVDTYGSKVAGGLRTAGFPECVADGPDWPEMASAVVIDPRVIDPGRIDACRARVIDAYGRVFPLAAST